MSRDSWRHLWPVRRQARYYLAQSVVASSEATEQIVTYARRKYCSHPCDRPPSMQCPQRQCLPAHVTRSLWVNNLRSADRSAVSNKRSGDSAHAVIEDFAQAISDVQANLKYGRDLGSKLNHLPPGILSLCRQTIKRSQELVGQWLHNVWPHV